MTKYRLAFIILLLVSPGPALASEAQVLFREAVARYQAGDYAASARLNERILDSGWESPAVYFNLGNGLIKQGRLGPAVLQYLRAEALAPWDVDIRANLAFARSLVERMDLPPGSGEKQQGLLASLGAGQLCWLFFAIVVFAGLFWVVGITLRVPGKQLVAVTVVALAAAGYVLMTMVPRCLAERESAVLLERADARFEPSDSATVYFILPEGTEVRLLRTKEHWAKVERADRRRGWVPAASVGKI